jgi:hypothetical protein
MTPSVGLVPVVRYLIPCEDVVRPAQDPGRPTIVGLLASLEPPGEPRFPYCHPHLAAFVQLSSCRGSGLGRVEVVQDDTEALAGRSQTQFLPFGWRPLHVFGVTFRVLDCLFQGPGLFWVRFCYNGVVLAQQPLLLR